MSGWCYLDEKDPSTWPPDGVAFLWPDGDRGYMHDVGHQVNWGKIGHSHYEGKHPFDRWYLIIPPVPTERPNHFHGSNI